MNKIHYGIELEFFVFNKETKELIPAYEVTHNLDNYKIIGELRSKTHDNIMDCVWEINKLLYAEQKEIAKKNPLADIVTIQDMATISRNLLQKTRQNVAIEKRMIKEHSIYQKAISHVLPITKAKIAFQINMSYNKCETIQLERREEKRWQSELFDFCSIIRELDDNFSDYIKKANRVPGVYAIKNGNMGSRIEYRSLPSSAFQAQDKLIDILSKY